MRDKGYTVEVKTTGDDSGKKSDYCSSGKKTQN